MLPFKKKSSSCLILILFFVVFVGAFFVIAIWEKYKLMTPNLPATPDVQRQVVETTDDPTWGAATGKIVIVEFGDFECPFCQQVFPVLHQLTNDYPTQIKFIYRDFLGHEHSARAAEAAECANEQGKFLAYHDKLFINQNNLTDVALKNYARQTGIADLDKFDQCFDSRKFKTETEQDFQEAIKLGVTGTPTFFINGYKIAGALPEKYFKQLIEKLLEETK